MKKYVVTASLAAGLSMISGHAFAQTSGSIGATVARADFSGGDADIYGVDGEVVLPTGGSWAGIIEAAFSDTEGSDETISATGHLITRDNAGAWGGFLGVADGGGSSVFIAGAEYAAFFDTSTFAANFSFGTDDDNDTDAIGVSGVYRIFGSDNLRFDINGGFTRADSGGFDADVWNAGAGVELRFDNSPFSIGAAYSHVDGDIAEADIFGFTFRINFGDRTLKEADRKGNTFRGVGHALSF